MADTGYTPFPTVQPTADALPPLSIPGDAEDFGAGIGRSLQRTGAIMRRNQEAEFGLQVQMAERAQETQALDASSAFSRKSSEMEIEFAKLNGQHAVDAFPEYQKNLAGLRTEIGQTLKGPLAQRAYKARTEGYETASLRSLGVHAANQGDAAYLAAKDGEISAATDRAVLHSLNDNVAPDYTEVISATLAKAQFQGLPKIAADAMVQKNISSVTASVIQGRIAAGKPEEALVLLKGAQATNAPGTEIPLLSGDVVAPLTAQVQGAMEAYGADYVQALDPLRRVDVLTKSIEGKTGTPADYLDPGDKAQGLRNALSDLKTLADQAEAARQKVLNEQNERKASDLKVRINRGLASVDEVERLYEQNGISGAQRAEWIKQIEDGGGANADATVFAALNGSAVLDPKNADDVKAVDGFFNRNIAPQLKVPFAAAGKNAARQGVTDFVMRTGIMPDAIKRQIRGGLRAGSPEFRVTAADMLDRISESNPYVLNDFAVEDIALGQTISQAVRDGLPPVEAVKLADDMERTPKDVRDMRSQRMNQRVAGQPSILERSSGRALEEITGRSWLGFVSGQPSLTVTDAAVSEFRRDFERAYILTGDEGAAAKSAQSVFKRSWGVSMLSGKPTLTKNGPEKLYGVLDHGPNDGAWIREQLVKDVGAQMRTPAEALPEGMMEPDENTESMFDFETFPMVKNADGTNSHIVTTIRGFEEGGKEVYVVLPTMVGGQQLTPEQADQRYIDTRKNFGKFPTVAQAEAWDKRQHEDLDAWLTEKGGGSSGPSLTMFPDVQSGAIYAAPPPRPKQVIDPARIEAEPDLQTGGDGTYGVMIRNDSGALEPMMDKSGRPMRWRPDWASSTKAAEVARQKQKQIDAAKVGREQQRLNMGLPPELQGAINLMR